MQVTVVFNADTGKYEANLAGMDKKTASSAQAVADAKNKILAYNNEQIQSAQALGKGFTDLQRITQTSAASMANVTEANARKIIDSLNRIMERKARMQEALTSSLRLPDGLAEEGAAADSLHRVGEEGEYAASHLQKTSAVFRGLRGNMMQNSRAAEAFLAQFQGLGAVIEGGFQVAGVVAIGAALYEMGEKGYHAYQNIVNLRDAIQGLNDLQISTSKHVEQLGDQTEERVEDILAKTQGRGASLHQKFAYQQNKGLDLSDVFYNDAVKKLPDDVKGNYENLYKAIAPADIPGRLSKIRTEVSNLQDALAFNKSGQFGAAITKVGDFGASNTRDPEAYMQARLNLAQQIQQQLEAASTYRDANLQAISTDATAADQKQNKAGAGKDHALEDLKFSFMQLGTMAPEVALAFWKKFADSSNEQVAMYATEQAKHYAEAFQKGLGTSPLIKGFNKQQEELANLHAPERMRSDIFGNTSESGNRVAETAARARLEFAQSQAEVAKVKVAIDLADGSISKLTADQRLAGISAKEHADRLADLQRQMVQFQKTANSWNPVTGRYNSDKEQEQYLGLQGAIGKEQTQQTVEAMKNAAAEAADSWKGALNNSIDQWAQHATDTAGQVRDLFNQGINGANENLVNMMSGDYKRGDWKRYGHSMFKSAAGDLLEQGEAKFLGPLGMGKKADGSEENPFHVVIASQGGAGGGGGVLSKIGGLGKIFRPFNGNGDGSSDGGGDGGGDDGQSSGIGGFFHSIFSSIANAFQGGKALGGGVDNSGFYDVGEMGRERVWLPRGSSVQPHNQMGGGGAVYSINVANGVTPEQVDMRVRAALQEVHPHIVRASVQAVHDHQQRQARRS